MGIFKVIPAIDILDGRCVRLFQGKYDCVTLYDKNPVELAKILLASGFDHIHLVDLDGARNGYPVNMKIVEAIAKTGIHIELGGGLRKKEDLQKALDHGAQELILGSLLINKNSTLKDWTAEFSGKLVAGIDARNGLVATKGWQHQTCFRDVDLAFAVENLGFQRIIYTDIARDGALSGPNLKRLKTVASEVSIPVTASGGVRYIKDINSLKELKSVGVTGVIVGKAFIEGKITLKEMQQC